MSITLGSMSAQVVLIPLLSFDFAKTYHVVVLPDPGGPIKNTQCLISNNSLSYIIFNVKSGCAVNRLSYTT